MEVDAPDPADVERQQLRSRVELHVARMRAHPRGGGGLGERHDDPTVDELFDDLLAVERDETRLAGVKLLLERCLAKSGERDEVSLRVEIWVLPSLDVECAVEL